MPATATPTKDPARSAAAHKAAATRARKERDEERELRVAAEAEAAELRAQSTNGNGNGHHDPPTAVTEPEPEEKRSSGRSIAIGALVLAFILGGVLIVNALTGKDGTDLAGLLTDPPESAYANGDGTAGKDGKLSPAEKQEAVVNELKAQKLQREEFTFVDKVCCGPVEAGQGAFGDPTKTVDELTEALAAETPGATAIRNEIEAKAGQQELNRALNGQAWVLVEFNQPVTFDGIGVLTEDGQALFNPAPRSVGPEDAVFYFVDASGKVRLDLSIRADCFNLGVGKVTAPGKPPSGSPGQPSPPSGDQKRPPEDSPPPDQPPPDQPPPDQPPPTEIPKSDTPTTDPGPTGDGSYQPPSDTEPPAGGGDNAPPTGGTNNPHNDPPVNNPGGGNSGPATDGGTTDCPTCPY